MALTIYDEDHSQEEERWVTLGQASNGAHLVVVHTWKQINPATAQVRIISPRQTTKAELRDYEGDPT